MTTVLPYEKGMSLGMGFKSLDHTHCQLGAVTIQGDAAKHPGQEVKFSLVSTSTQSELADALDISASLAIDKGSVGIHGYGDFLKKQTIANADMNFVVKVTVENSYRASEKVPTFNIGQHKDASSADFYQVLGDSYVADVIEGGQFVGVLSVKTRSHAELMAVKAKLEVSFSGVQAKGAGAYDKSELEKMASMDVNVTRSGANVNEEGQGWTMELMFDEASKFPGQVAQNRIPISVITKSYLSLPSFTGLPNFKKYLLPENNAQSKSHDMLNAYTELEKLSAELTAMLKGVNDGQIVLKKSNGDAPYAADASGLQKASGEVTTAIDTIKTSIKLLRKSPAAAEGKKSENVLKPYKLAEDIRFNIPLVTNSSTISSNRPAVGSAVGACGFTSEDKSQAYAFWQDFTRAIYTSKLTGETWTFDTKPVLNSAKAHTPLAACCSKDGKEASFFYFTDHGVLTHMRLIGGSWAEGDLYEQMKPLPADKQPYMWTDIASFQGNNSNVWVFYQNDSMHIVAAMLDAGNKQWTFNVVLDWTMPLGSAMTAASVTNKNDHDDAETFMLGCRGMDHKVWELRYDGNAWISSTQVLSQKLPPDASICAYNAGDNKVTFVVVGEDGKILYATWTKDKPTWTEEGSVGVGVRGGGLAAASWRSDTARILTQTQESMDLNDFVLNGGKWTASGIVNKL